jgi:hypothetical protein
MVPQNKTHISGTVFESYGVSFALRSNEAGLLEKAVQTVRTSLLGNLSISDKTPDFTIELEHTGRNYAMRLNNDEIASGTSGKKFIKFLDSVIRASVGEYVRDRIFLHAGAVGWKGGAILLPADSFKGKSTLVTEMVKHGAEYLSDDFAIIDKEGIVHPFPRPINLRTPDFRPYRVSVDTIGKRADIAMPVAAIIFTEYVEGATWAPARLSPGKGALEMIPFSLTFRREPELTLAILNKVASRAIIASGPRGNAADTVADILNFVDKNAN